VNTHGHAWRFVSAFARRQYNSRTSGTQHDRRYGYVQSIETASFQEARKRIGPTLDQYSAHPGARQRTNDCRRFDIAVMLRQSNGFDAGGRSAMRSLGRNQQPANAIVGEHPGVCSEAPLRIYHCADRLRAGYLPDRQLRIVRQSCSNAYDDDVDKSAQPMKMLDAGRAIDKFRMARSRGDPTIQRLTELSHNNQVIDRSLSQGAKQISPKLRKRLLPVPEQSNEVLPTIGGREFADGGKTAELHG
jgi:hypothetical protein